MHELEAIVLNFKNVIFYGSYLVFPFIIFLLFKLKNWSNILRSSKIILISFIIVSLVFIDARFIEPNIITVHHKDIQIGLNKKLKIALISDIHLGIYTDESLLHKMVKNINEIANLDYVFIAGDLTYFQEGQTEFHLEKLFSGLQEIKTPIYWVLGNHDVERPGPKVRNELISLFEKYNFHYLNNKKVKLDGFTLVGLGSNWGREDDVSLLEHFTQEEAVIVLTHNPDTISKYTNKNADLTLCGHTHGGQVKLPYIYKKMIPTQGEFDEGLTTEKNTKLFVSSGIGVVGLPFRFLNPPVIDVLEVH